jgi:hypothetical protein
MPDVSKLEIRITRVHHFISSFILSFDQSVKLTYLILSLDSSWTTGGSLTLHIQRLMFSNIYDND